MILCYVAPCAQGMHEVAYTGGLAKPLIAPESALSKLSSEMLYDFVARNYTASRMTVAGSGLMIVRTCSPASHILALALGISQGLPCPRCAAAVLGTHMCSDCAYDDATLMSWTILDSRLLVTAIAGWHLQLRLMLEKIPVVLRLTDVCFFFQSLPLSNIRKIKSMNLRVGCMQQGEVRGFSMHLFEGLPSVEPVPQPPSTYVGGDFRWALRIIHHLLT